MSQHCNYTGLSITGVQRLRPSTKIESIGKTISRKYDTLCSINGFEPKKNLQSLHRTCLIRNFQQSVFEIRRIYMSFDEPISLQIHISFIFGPKGWNNRHYATQYPAIS